MVVEQLRAAWWFGSCQVVKCSFYRAENVTTDSIAIISLCCEIKGRRSKNYAILQSKRTIVKSWLEEDRRRRRREGFATTLDCEVDVGATMAHLGLNLKLASQRAMNEIGRAHV